AMSAGTGVFHSEYNKNPDKEVHLLQIWVLPKKRNIEPTYSQISLKLEDRKNKLQQIVSPNSDDAGVTINQDAWFNITELDAGKSIQYTLNDPKNGVYAFIIEGNASVNDQKLNSRDGLGIHKIENVGIKE